MWRCRDDPELQTKVSSTKVGRSMAQFDPMVPQRDVSAFRVSRSGADFKPAPSPDWVWIASASPPDRSRAREPRFAWPHGTYKAKPKRRRSQRSRNCDLGAPAATLPPCTASVVVPPGRKGRVQQAGGYIRYAR